MTRQHHYCQDAPMSDTQQPVYYQHIVVRTNGSATAALILGIIAFVFGFWAWVPLLGILNVIIGGALAIMAVTFGHMGRKTFKEIGVGDGKAVTGLILGYTTLGIIALVIITWIISLIANAINS